MHAKQDCRAVASLRGAEAPWRNLSKLKDGAITNKEKPSCAVPWNNYCDVFCPGFKKNLLFTLPLLLNWILSLFGHFLWGVEVKFVHLTLQVWFDSCFNYFVYQFHWCYWVDVILIFVPSSFLNPVRKVWENNVFREIRICSSLSFLKCQSTIPHIQYLNGFSF